MGAIVNKNINIARYRADKPSYRPIHRADAEKVPELFFFSLSLPNARAGRISFQMMPSTLMLMLF